MRIAIGSDHRGLELRQRLIALLESQGQEVFDAGGNGEGDVDYPDVAESVARRVGQGEAERGILICGTGLGMSMACGSIVPAAPGVSLVILSMGSIPAAAASLKDGDMTPVQMRGLVTKRMAKAMISRLIRAPVLMGVSRPRYSRTPSATSAESVVTMPAHSTERFLVGPKEKNAPRPRLPRRFP